MTSPSFTKGVMLTPFARNLNGFPLSSTARSSSIRAGLLRDNSPAFLMKSSGLGSLALPEIALGLTDRDIVISCIIDGSSVSGSVSVSILPRA